MTTKPITPNQNSENPNEFVLVFSAFILKRATAPQMVHNRGVRRSTYYFRKSYKGRAPVLYKYRGYGPFEGHYHMAEDAAHVRLYHKHLAAQEKARKEAAFQRLIYSYIIPNIMANQKIWRRKPRKSYGVPYYTKYKK
jgi:hypothetical protein